MTLTWPLVAAVLCGAALHAGWNAVVKATADKAVDIALVSLGSGLLALPLLGLSGLPPRQSLLFIAASMSLHIAYYATLAGAYRHGELGQTYPVMRGTAPLLVALASAALLGEAPSAVAWLGIGGIAAGVLAVGLSRSHGAGHWPKALGYALANATMIAGYTLVDSLGVRASVQAGHGAMAYVMLLFVVNTLPFAALLWWQRDAAGRAAMRSLARSRWMFALFGGAASIGSYAIALWAMTRAPVASVAALRETSVLFAALLGTWLLKERFGVQRALGTALIVAGVVGLRLG